MPFPAFFYIAKAVLFKCLVDDVEGEIKTVDIWIKNLQFCIKLRDQIWEPWSIGTNGHLNIETSQVGLPREQPIHKKMVVMSGDDFP